MTNLTEIAADERSELRQNWILIVACMVGFGFGTVSAASAGLFMEPLEKEFGWSRTLLSSGLSISALVGVFVSPLLGIGIDRWGTRRIVLTGIVLTAFVLSSLSQMTGAVWMWFAIWTAYAFTGAMIKSTVWSASISSAFDKSRGIALGFALSGTAIAQAIVPPLTHLLIDSFGWRNAFIWLGMGGGTLAFVFCGLFLFDGYDKSRRQRAKQGHAKPKGPLLDVPGLSIAQAWRSVALWRIAISLFLMMTITIALNVHQFEILRASGVDRASASLYTGITGIAGVAGKLVTGWLLDRYHARWVGGWTLALTVIAFIILSLPSLTAPMIIAAMIINGYAAGTKLQIASFLTSAYGGMRNFGTIYATLAIAITAGSGLGPVFAGLIFDWYGNYGPFLMFGIIGTLISSWLIFGLGDYPKFEELPEEAVA
ncbi:MAG: MFS transporter [Novosphingobium sp.]